MLVKVADKDTDTVVTALIKSAQKLPRELYKSLTWDRGKELSDHPRFTLATDVNVYFCDPQSPLSSLQAATAVQCVATRIKRKHQPAFEALFAKRNRLIRPFPSKTHRNRKAT
jgi:hypothetical protein